MKSLAIDITVAEAKAILFVTKGADVYDYGLARTLRGLERRGVFGLVQIVKPQAYEGNGADQVPYFGVIATPIGRAVARATLQVAKREREFNRKITKIKSLSVYLDTFFTSIK